MMLLNESAVFAGMLNVAAQAVLAHEMWVAVDSPAAILRSLAKDAHLEVDDFLHTDHARRCQHIIEGTL
tara:strand:- start:11 stop:217 length:207 start_codon:yes stop_codon:yes gene_type:complete